MAISAPSSTPGNCSGVTSGSRWMRTLGSPGFSSRSKIKASDSLASTKTPCKASLPYCPYGRLSGRDAGERKHRVHQHVGARRAIGLRGVFELVVTDAILARDKHHRRRNARIQVTGIVAGARRNAPIGIAERRGGILHRIDQSGIEM